MRLFSRTAVLAVVVLASGAIVSALGYRGEWHARDTSCEDLAKLKLPDTAITGAQMVAAGAFVPPAAAGATNQAYAQLPAFCRVTATLTPSKDSDIKIEVWMPATGWNQRFQGVGNGGWAGTINYAALAAAIARGYAAASTDTGHVGGTGAFALGHPEKLVDFGYRAVHEMTVQGKAIVNTFYSNQPKLSIWNGCSQGGRQGITEAARYPADYAGVIAGAPALYQMQIHATRVALNVFANRGSDTAIPAEKYAMVHEAVLAACDARDGVKDGVIDLPTSCAFDPKTLECKGADGPTCLTSPQVETMKKMYMPVTGAHGEVIGPPLLQSGTELGWGTLAGRAPLNLSVDAMKYVVFKEPNWDWRQFNPATDIDRTIKEDADVVNYTNPNLSAFFKRSGKLLMYHGWADPQVPAQNAIKYFNEVTTTNGPSVVGKSIQLYLVPGMGHCQGGPGTDTFDKVAAIEQWIQTGTAPNPIVASHLTRGTVDRTRPLCGYGQVAKWDGKGSTDEAASFSCVAATVR
jgi:feruloyl esterase